jgi:hypothetical protein
MRRLTAAGELTIALAQYDQCLAYVKKLEISIAGNLVWTTKTRRYTDFPSPNLPKTKPEPSTPK